MTDIWASEPRFQEHELAAVMQQLFEAGGVGAGDAVEATSALLQADLRGIESHGVARLPGYIRRLRGGLIDPDARLDVLRETPSTIAFDANNGLGLIAGRRAMERCIAKAQETGICMATVRRSNHFGIAGTYALMAAQQGLGGMAMTNSSAIVVPMFSKEPMLGTNPLAFAVPTGGLPFCLDMSTSTVAFGKIEMARRAGIPIPAGWGLDADGRSTTDPNAVQGLTPLGGPREMSGHKGYGLGLMVEIFCSHLASNAWSHEIGASYVSDAPTSGTGHAFIAWRIDAFRDLDEFKADLDAMLATLRGNDVSDDYPGEQVLIPGDPESEAERYNREHGIPVRRTVLRQMAEVAAECGVEMPFTLE
ncbi:MAG TPA: Ldh family oxidoreductase [Thermomicrobiales bacterium]|nr:Ldh family oxidoreductase [Thermomicrobiales bacterium]